MANVANLIDPRDLVFRGNVRTAECEAIPEMVENYRRDGFLVEHPLVVSKKVETAEGGPDIVTYLVLQGNRRGLGLAWLDENDPDAYKAALPSGGKIPAIIHEGLTEEEETILRIDHSTALDRVPLDEFSLYLAIKQLASAGYDTQERIAEKLGIVYTKGKKVGEANRSYVQPRLNLARLPQFVEDEMRKYTLDSDSTALRWSDLATLYKHYNGEFSAHPDGDGPLFSGAWESAITPKVKEEASDSKKAFTPTDAVKRAQVASSKGLSRALMIVTGQSEEHLGDIDRAIVEGETAVLLLARIRAYLGDDDYAVLVEAASEPELTAEPDCVVPMVESDCQAVEA